MACSIEKNAKNGKINKILGKDGKTSTLFQEIFNVPTLTLNEAIEAFKNTYSDKIRYQIIGEKGASKVEQYQQTLNQAKTLEKQGKDYSKTGWFKNEQGQWKYFSNEILNEFLSLPQVKNKIVDLKDLLKKESILLKAYPELENTKIEFYEGTKGADFRGDEQINGTVTEEGETTILHIRTDSKGTADYGGILVHELNHKLQRIDNFARGGSPKFLLKLAIFITNSQNLPNKDAVNKIKNFDTSSLDKESKKIIEIVQKAFNNPLKATQLLEDGYFLLQGEIDSRAVELALELKNKLGRYKNFTYSELVKELGKREGIDLINEAISIFVDDVALSKQAVKAPQITQEIIDRLKQNGLSGDVFLLSTEEINAKLIELGVGEDVRKQVIAWHRSNNKFYNFSTDKIGTGFGKQNYGWGLYFSDSTPNNQYGDYLYKVNLFKDENEYNLINLKSSVEEDVINKVVESLNKLNKKTDEVVEFGYNGLLFYKTLSRILGNDKKASLFLLENGIKGLKNEIGRGSNDYIIFDENAITIEEQIQFQKSLNNVGINLITNGFTVKEYPTNSKILDILIAKNVIEKVC